MTLGIGAATANSILDALCRGTSWTPPSAVWIKLHLGDPGSGGASNPAVETTREQASFAAASGGSIANSVAVTWTNVAASEDYTHFSAWDAQSSGTFLFSGTVTANAVTATNSFTVDAGGLTTSLTIAA